MLLEDMLTDMGHTVVAIVPGVNEALAAAQREEFDLAILDVHLNGQAVFPVADALIERGIPFVFATGYGERGFPEQYRKRPILQKPFAKDDLEKILAAFEDLAGQLCARAVGADASLAPAKQNRARRNTWHASKSSTAPT